MAGMFERDLIVRALIFDGAHRGDEPRVIGARRVQASAQRDAVGAHRNRTERVLDHIVTAEKSGDEFVAGFSNRSRGVAICSMRPLFITTTSSASARASSWPCVTWIEGDVELFLEPAKRPAS